MKLKLVAATLVAALAMPFAAWASDVKIPEGTEISIKFDDKLSSATAHEGDRFSISLAEEIVLPDGTIIPAGARGAGEVTHAKKRGMMGKAGELNVRFDYIRVGETRIRLRGSKGAEGEGRIGTTVVLTVLFGPLGLIKHGKDIEIDSGQRMRVFTDADATVVVAPKVAS